MRVGVCRGCLTWMMNTKIIDKIREVLMNLMFKDVFSILQNT